MKIYMVSLLHRATINKVIKCLNKNHTQTRIAAKTQNPLKFVGVPQTPEPISAVSGPKFTILSGHVEEVLLLNKFFPDCGYVP